MKIAFFYNLSFGGAKRVVFEQARGLSKKHQIDVYTTDFSKDIFDPSVFANNIYRYEYSDVQLSFPFVGRFIRDIRLFTTLRSLHKKIAHEINEKKYDLVIVHPDKFTQSPFILRYLTAPSFYICQEPLRIAYEYFYRLNGGLFAQRWYEALFRNALKNVDIRNVRSAVFPVASCLHIRERMIEAYDVYPDVLYAGVDSNVFKPIDVKKKIQVFFIGDPLDKLSGYHLLEKSISLIPVGQRPSVKVLKWEKNNKKRLSDEQVNKIYNESIATLCLNMFETFGLTPLESMSAGTPVIATNVSGHRETVLSNKTGYLVDYDPFEIASKIIKLIENEKLQKSISISARKYIESTWSWKKRIEDLEQLINKVNT